MRDPNRLDEFYSELNNIHKRSFQDLRFIQFQINFMSWLVTEKRTDGWHYEEDKTLKLLKEYECIYGMR